MPQVEASSPMDHKRPIEANSFFSRGQKCPPWRCQRCHWHGCKVSLPCSVLAPDPRKNEVTQVVSSDSMLTSFSPHFGYCGICGTSCRKSSRLVGPCQPKRSRSHGCSFSTHSRRVLLRAITPSQLATCPLSTLLLVLHIQGTMARWVDIPTCLMHGNMSMVYRETLHL